MLNFFLSRVQEINTIDLYLYIGFAAVLMAALGSFLGALHYRLQCKYIDGKSVPVWSGRSKCTHCDKSLKPQHLIPIFSWILQRGCCAYCHQPVSVNYICIELATVGSWLLAMLVSDVIITQLVIGFLGGILYVLMLIDLRHLIIPDELLWMILALSIVTISTSLDWQNSLISSAWGAGVGFALTWIVRFIFLHRKGQEAMGLGDVKLMSCAGFWVGASLISWVIFLAAAMTLLGAGLLALFRPGVSIKEVKIPFGPGIAVAFYMAVLLKESGHAEVLKTLFFGGF